METVGLRMLSDGWTEGEMAKGVTMLLWKNMFVHGRDWLFISGAE